ncbi:MAG: non-canonical purine NTP diphosphatase [Vicingaceae bacterium]
MQEIVFATNNPNKLEEIRQIFGKQVKILSLKDINCSEELPETQASLEGNALQKAKYVNEHYGFDCFADDTGLEVHALEGRPGVYSARYAGPECSSEENIEKLLNEMKGKPERKAVFRTVIAWVSEKGNLTFEGAVNGKISENRKGTKGFGYDPIFIPAGYNESFAQMSAEQKNGISHRRRAVDAFSTAFLAGQ